MNIVTCLFYPLISLESATGQSFHKFVFVTIFLFLNLYFNCLRTSIIELYFPVALALGKVLLELLVEEHCI